MIEKRRDQKHSPGVKRHALAPVAGLLVVGVLLAGWMVQRAEWASYGLVNQTIIIPGTEIQMG
jgi:hypothetical protein